MRHTLIAMIAMAVPAACVAGSSSSGATGATTATGGGTTGGTSLLQPGAACETNAACTSNVCGTDGKGNCCAKACATTDPFCEATACDATGACTYPTAGESCGAPACSQNLLVLSACNGAGGCDREKPVACDGGFICAGKACKIACDSSADCAANLACNNHLCVAPIDTGTCTENEDCSSDLCGTIGDGHCCNSACIAGGPCGAIDCDDTGACLYVDAGTRNCGGSPSCTNQTATIPSSCDGQGSCSKVSTLDCQPYLCGPLACLTRCSDGTSCGSGAFCDVTSATCCAGLFSGSMMTVDSAAGSDTSACCGIGSNRPCQTLTQAMRLIDEAFVGNVTLAATVDGGFGDWAPEGEVYPIVLGWGAELSAPGVHFTDSHARDNEVIDIAAFSANDTLVSSASIVGTAANPVFVGFDSAGNQSSDFSAVQVESGRSLYLANASLNGNAADSTAALTVSGGASLVLGQDQAAAVTGTVTIGNSANKHATNGYEGIVCAFDPLIAKGCTISDVALGSSSVVIQGQENQDIDGEAEASISLKSFPVIGIPPQAIGFNQCSGKPDVSGPGNGSGEAVNLGRQAKMIFDNGTVQCISGDAFHLASPIPTLQLDGTTIQNTERAIYVEDGTVTVTNSTIRFNYIGAEQDNSGPDGAIVYLAGTDGGMNTVICSSKKETTNPLATNPGVSVLNTSKFTGDVSTLAADDVNWDTPGPDLFQCSGFSSCTCELATCTVAPGSDGMDAVSDSAGTITTAGNGVSTTSCTSP